MSVKPTPECYAAVICHGDSVPDQQPCGQVPLSQDEYNRQMNKPDSLWTCPRCGSTADFDDALFEDLHYSDEPQELDGEVFRGGEAAAYQAEQMAAWQRLK